MIATRALDEFGTAEERKGRFVAFEIRRAHIPRVQRALRSNVTRGVRARPTVHRNEWFFAPFKDCPIENANITLGRAGSPRTPRTDGEGPVVTHGRARIPAAPQRRGDTPPCQITLTTDKPAFFVWVNATGVRGEFDDNSFTLLPDEPRTLTFTPKEPIDAETFRRSLSVTDLSKSFDAATQSAAGQRKTKRGREP